MKNININRREFLISSATVGAGLLLGCSSKDALSPIVSAAKSISGMDTWIRIDPTGMLTLLCPSNEMGQGVHTALPMLVCEELDADWEKVKVEFAGLNDQYIRPESVTNMQSTGGSTSVKDWSPTLRRVGATARLMLRRAAAQKWGVPVAECTTKQGQVFHKSGKILDYGELAPLAAAVPVPTEEELELKNPKQFQLLGKPIKRKDTPLKVNGSAKFGIDTRVPGMVYATACQSPVFGGEVAGMDKAAALAVKGVLDVVPIPNGMAVVAESYWLAKKGLQALSLEFKGGDQKFSSVGLSEKFKRDLDGVEKKSFPDAAKTIEAEYEVPFMAHACMEPMNCTVSLTEDRCEVWVPTQSQSMTGRAVTEITGLPPEKIDLHVTFLGGGFGRRAEVDFVKQAVIVAQAVKKPVKLVWSREEDIQHDFYRPASRSRFQVGLDEEGKIRHWDSQIAIPSILDRLWEVWNPMGLGWLPYTLFYPGGLATEGAEIPYESKEEAEPKALTQDSPVPVGPWRSVGDSHNGFYVESMMDEAAHAAGIDPYEFRRMHLQDTPKNLKTLELAVEKAGWGKTAKGRFQGLAVHASFSSCVAHVMEISVDSKGAVKVHKVVSAVHCGLAVNPNIVKAQIEGSIVWGLTAALIGEITLENGRIAQSNFHDYHMLRMAQTPEIEVHIVESNEPSTGIGEPGVPPVAPALTNAIFAATGKRIRSLPLSKHKLV